MYEQQKKGTVLGVLIICLVWGVTSCVGGGSSGLPERGQEELTAYVEKLTESSVEFEIVSIEQAPDYSDPEQQISYAPDEDYISGCPDDTGGRNMWCVVVDREIVSTRGKAYSHFLVQNLSGHWYIDELDDTEEDEFLLLGCKNWEASLASSE